MRRLEADAALARRAGAIREPTLFVNGLYWSATAPYAELRQLVEKELARVDERPLKSTPDGGTPSSQGAPMPAPASCRSLFVALAVLGSCLAAPALAQEPTPAPRRDPLRLTSLGDSVTEAINAEEFNPLKGLTRNRWASWVNGYTKDWNSLLDRTDVNSHNQRIAALFGEEGRKNKQSAKRGADSENLLRSRHARQ